MLTVMVQLLAGAAALRGAAAAVCTMPVQLVSVSNMPNASVTASNTRLFIICLSFSSSMNMIQ
jgi:hypothetical protein